MQQQAHGQQQQQQVLMNYRNAVQPSAPQQQQQQAQLATERGGNGGNRAFGGSRFINASSIHQQNVFSNFYPSNSGGSGGSAGAMWSNGGGAPKKGHRNTMPSLAISPFTFQSEQLPRQAHSHAQQNNRQAAVDLPSSLNCMLVQFTSGRTDTYYVPPNHPGLNVEVGDYVVVEADRGEDLGRVIMDNINVALPRRNSVSSFGAQQHSHQTLYGGSGGYGAAQGGGGMFGEFSGLLPSEYGAYGSGSQSSSSNPSPTFELEECMTSSHVYSSSQSNLSSSSSSNGPASALSGGSGGNMPKKIYRVAVGVEVESLLVKVRDEMNAIAVAQYKVQEWKLPMVVIDAEYQCNSIIPTSPLHASISAPWSETSIRLKIYRTRIWMYCVDKDKNRSNRAHLREKFLKGLFETTGVSSLATTPVNSRSSAPPACNGNDEGQYANSGPYSVSVKKSKSTDGSGNGGAGSGASAGPTNSLKAVLEEVSNYDNDGGETLLFDEWDSMSEVFKLQQMLSPIYQQKMHHLQGKRGCVDMNGGGGIDALEFGLNNLGFGQVVGGGGGAAAAVTVKSSGGGVAVDGLKMD